MSGSYLKFVPAPPKPKTKVWWVVQERANIHLGWIGWWGAWRRYAFYPKANTVFEEQCLEDISDFIQQQTHQHRIAQRKARLAVAAGITEKPGK